MNRRDLIKFFSVGTIIAPVAAAAAPLAKLIEVPKIEIVEAATIPEPLNVADIKSVVMTFTLHNGERRQVAADPVYGIACTLHPNDTLMMEVRLSLSDGYSPRTGRPLTTLLSSTARLV